MSASLARAERVFGNWRGQFYSSGEGDVYIRRRPDARARPACLRAKKPISFFLLYTGPVPKSIRPAFSIVSSFDCVGVTHHEVRMKRPHFWANRDRHFYHGNDAAAHSPNLVQQLLAKHRIAQFRQSPYCPNVAKCMTFGRRTIRKCATSALKSEN